MYMTDLPQRKTPAHPSPVERFNEPIVLMVTIGLRDRSPYHCLDNQSVHTALRKAWRSADEWLVGNFMIMPDHVHFFCVPGVHEAPPVTWWCKKWKGLASADLGEKPWRWLPDCWDTQMRDQAHYDEKLSYVLNNPVRKALVDHPDDWPFQGQLHTIRW